MSNFRWPAVDTDGSYWNNEHEPAPGDNAVKFTSATRRFFAMALDWILPFVAIWLIHGEIGDFILIAMWVNSIWLQGRTGQSVGKMAVGIRLAYVPEGMDATTWTFLVPGITRCALRYLAHVVDWMAFGYVKALINPYGRSWADALTHCVVVQDNQLTTREEATAVRLQIRPERRLLPRGAVLALCPVVECSLAS